jgi:formylmethanofuran dehydrogenase subunit D
MVIRMNPAHDVEHPPGQIVVPVGTPANVINQSKTLQQEIEEYKNKDVKISLVLLGLL